MDRLHRLKKNRSLWRFAAMALVLLVAACGDDGEPEAERPPFTVLLARDVVAGARQDELDLAARFAESQGLRLEVERVDGLASLWTALLAGQGDIALGNLTATPSRSEQVAFTAPVGFVEEVVIGATDRLPETRQELAGRTVAIDPDSSFAETLKLVQQRRFQPEFSIVPLPGPLGPDDMPDAIASGLIDLTVLDSNLAEEILQGREDVGIGFSLGQRRPIAWAVSPDRPALLERLNGFIANAQLLDRTTPTHKEDLPGIQARGELRMATRNNAASFFLWRGQLMGFDYELMRRFAEQQGLALKVAVPEPGEDVLSMVLGGKADIAAASLTITPERIARGVRFSHPTNRVSEIVVARADDPAPPDVLAALAGRVLAVRADSSYAGTLAGLQRDGIDLAIKSIAEEIETETILAQLAEGAHDLAVADSHILDIELTWRDDIVGTLALGPPREHGWAVRAENPALLAAVNDWLDEEYRGLFYNITHSKYFDADRTIFHQADADLARSGSQALSPFDDLVRAAAAQYGFDWRLLTAQMYQESRFDPAATSWMGAIGLMQVLPRTARELGATGDLTDPKTGIETGAAYLDWLRRRFEPELDPGNRTWFALAAYNAGIGHVRDARRLAREKGWDPDVWFGSVEQAMLLLGRRPYASQARHGYARGTEPVAYVREIRDRFAIYAALVEADPETASAE